MSAPADTRADAEGHHAHRVILASAGTGKTWQLSNRFLALLLDGQLEGDEGLTPERVLATTFTRKAAGEILDRLLQRLAAAAVDDEACARLCAEVGARPRPRDELLSLVVAIGRRLDRFQVRTLDSWFVSLARAHGLDLGLPPSWSVVDEADGERLQSEAVARALGSAPAAEMLELLDRLQREDPGRAAHQVMLEAVTDAHAAYVESGPEAWERLVPPPPLAPEDLARHRDDLARITPPLTGKGTPNTHWATSLEKLTTAVADGDWPGLLAVGLVEKVLAGETQYSRVDIEDPVAETVAALAGHAGALLLARMAASALSLRELVTRYDAELTALKRERRSLRFDDIPRALLEGDRSLAAGDPVRLGAPVGHLLLDEFQDTSVQQWRVVEPLARQIVAAADGRRSLFCVGDVKQAIYAWREGESRLLSGLDGRLAPLTSEPLDESWRSSQVVLDLVNAVFGDLGGLDVWRDPDLSEAAGRWSAGFREHRRAAAAGALPGQAHLFEVPVTSRNSRVDDMLAATLRHVARLGAEAPGADIGVLVRGNRFIPHLIQGLRELGLSASGVGGNSLLDARSVRAALALLWLADHPGDGAALLLARATPLGAAFGLDDAADPREVARDLRRRLVRDGYGPTLAAGDTVVAADPAFGAWDRRRYAQLVDLAFAWDARAGLRPRDFVTHVRAATVEDEVPAAIKVMTVHKSKGLEFDAVVLPDLDGDLVRAPKGLWTRRRDPFGGFDTVFPVVNQALLPLWAEAVELAEWNRSREVEEQLCVAYVAMTRAKRRLDLLVPSAYWKTSAPRSFAMLLREVLPLAEPDERGVVWAHADNADDWAPPAPEPLPSSDSSTATLALAPGRPMRRRRSPSSQEGGRRVEAARLLARGGRRARDHGSLVHHLMAEITWLEDRDPDVEARRARAQAAAVRGGWDLSADDIEAGLVAVDQALAQSPLRELLTGGPGRAGRTVWRERRFDVLRAGPEGCEEALGGSFDRVVLEGAVDAPTGATVIDFKSDRPPRDADLDSWLADKTAFYAPQVQAYREALTVLTGLPADSIEGRLAFLVPGVVVPVA